MKCLTFLALLHGLPVTYIYMCVCVLYTHTHTIDTAATVMRQRLEDKCEVVGQVSFPLPIAYCLSTVTRVWDRAVAGHSNADVMTPVAWPATVTYHLCLCQP